jgi:hypothetical protein
LAAAAALAFAAPAAGHPEHLIAIGACGSGGVMLLALQGEGNGDDGGSGALFACHAVTSSELRAKRPRRS